MNKKVVIPAITLICIGVIGMVITGKNYLASEHVRGEKTIQSEEIESIYIDSSVANLQIQPSQSDTIQVVWEGGRFGLEESDVNFNVEGDRLNISLGKKTFFNFFNLMKFQFAFNYNRLNVNVYVPEKYVRLINVKNNVGSTELSSLQLENLVVTSDVADITLENIAATSLDVKSSVGKVTLKQIEARVSAKNDVGEIVVLADDIHEDMTLISDIGNIKVKVPHILENISFQGRSDIGSISIFGSNKNHLADYSHHVVDIETDIGNIDVVVD